MATRRRSDSRRTSSPASPGASETAPPALTGASAPSSTARAASAEPRPSRRRTPAEPRTTGDSGVGEPGNASGPVILSAETRRAMIAKAAYLRAERRGFAPGREEEDWLAAEKEVDALLSAGPGEPQ